MGDQADMEARAKTVLAEHCDGPINGLPDPYEPWGGYESETIAAMLAYAAEREAAAYARAAEVARSVKRRVPFDQNKHPCTTTMEQIARAIEALGEAKG